MQEASLEALWATFLMLVPENRGAMGPMGRMGAEANPFSPAPHESSKHRWNFAARGSQLGPYLNCSIRYDIESEYTLGLQAYD